MTNMSPSKSTMSATKRALQALKQSQEKLAAWERTKYEPIAVIGIGCRFPGEIENAEDFRRFLVEGRDAIGPVPNDRWDMETYFHPEPGKPGKIYSREGGFLAALDQFDPQFFNISPVEAKSMDPQQRLLLEVAWEAFEHAGQAPHRLFGSQTGVFVGMSNFDFATQMSKVLTAEEIGTYFGTGNALSVGAGRLSYVFGLTGPSMVVDTACSSSLVSTDLACRSLRNGECDLALAAGVNLIFAPETSVNFSKNGMLSIDSRCKTFAASANGYVRSEGCGVILLKRLSDALADGDRILAQIAGSAVNQDGPSGGLTVPNGVSQEKVIRQALANARTEPAQIDYIEAHGTGTSLGDPIEIEALSRIFSKDRQPNQSLIVGSVKTNIGHGEGAAGIAGIIKVILAMHEEAIPRHLHLDEPNPHIPWDELPIKVPLKATPWQQSERPRLAGVSSFGFSGTNAHVILKEPPSVNKPVAEKERPLHAMALSAKSKKALKDLTEQYISRLQHTNEAEFADVCFTANVGRTHFRHRLCSFGSNPQQLSQMLQAFVKGESPSSPRLGELKREETPPKPVFLFTGQGSQFVGMGRELFETQPTFRKTLLQCADYLESYMDRPLLEILFPADGDSLIHETAYAQPAIFALEYALAQMLMAWGIRPAAVLGHSVGELTAACVAGVFSLEDGLRLIAKRGQVLQALPKLGGMRVVFASKAEIVPLLEPWRDTLAIAAINGPRNLVLSGENAALAKIVEQLESMGIETRALPVSHAFHSPLVEPAMEAFGQCLEGISFSKPTIPMIGNLHGDFVREEVTSTDYWLQHFRQPVLFAKGMRALEQRAYRLFIELGPKPVLRAMGQRVLEGKGSIWLDTCRQKGSTWANMMQSMTTLYCLGVISDWQDFEKDYPRNIVTVPTYPFQRGSFWPEAALAARDRKKDASQLVKESPATTEPLTIETLDKQPPRPNQAVEHVLHDVREIVAKLQQTDAETVDPHTSLVALGSDPSFLIEVVKRIEKDYGVKLAIRQLYGDLPNLAALANYIMQKSASSPVKTTASAPNVIPQTNVSRPLNSDTSPLQDETVNTTSDGKVGDMVPSKQDEELENVIAQQLEAMSNLMKDQLAIHTSEHAASSNLFLR